METARQQSTPIMHNMQTQPCWYAVYTRPCFEKRVYEQLVRQNIQAYLPLQTTIRQWSDRRKKLSEPLFSCYVFVHIGLREYYTVLNLIGVVRYVTFCGKAVSIPEKQIKLIRNLLAEDMEVVEAAACLPVGTQVRIKAGPLTGIAGELVEHAGKKRVIIRIEEICKALLVNVPMHYLELAGK
jgi:transcription antitermination factor NusG